MSDRTFEQWLKEEHSLEPRQIILRAQNIARDAERYIMDDDDEERVMKVLENDEVIDAVSAIRERLDEMGLISLPEFPFAEVDPPAQPYVLRALQKEVASSIPNALNLPADSSLSFILYREENELYQTLKNLFQ